MKRKALLILWPLVFSPIWALAVARYAGPTYDVAPNQSAMVVRMLGLLIWIGVLVVGASVSPMLIHGRTKTDIFACFGSCVAGGFIAFAVLTTVN